MDKVSWIRNTCSIFRRRVPTDLFNRVIWQGLMDRPYPTVRSGVDLRQHREQLLKTSTSQSGAKELNIKVGGE